MADIIKPENVNAAVMPLPAHQTPYGEACSLTKQFQSILFHYDLRQNEVDIFDLKLNTLHVLLSTFKSIRNRSPFIRVANE